MFRLPTREVRIGNLTLGAGNPIRIQTMTTTDTLDIEATVAQTIRCIEAGAELVRITAPSKKEAEALGVIKQHIRAAGFDTPLVADIHFTPNAAEIAARLIEKVRVNPGNYVDKKKFDFIEYTDIEYRSEVDRIRERFTPLVRICKEYGTAMRIGTNHGSLSDRIMSRYGDTAIGMVESAMEFLRIARDEAYHQIVLSMKSSNPIVMVEAYRLLVQTMQREFGECYPLHLGVTEAGDGEDGRIKSAIGIGTLLEEGIGDTIRVSLTEDPEFELPVCRDLVKKALTPQPPEGGATIARASQLMVEGARVGKTETTVANIGAGHVPVVVADFMHSENMTPEYLGSVGYRYDAVTDKWSLSDAAADYVFLGNKTLDFDLPGTVRPVVFGPFWQTLSEAEQAVYIPCFTWNEWQAASKRHAVMNLVSADLKEEAMLEGAGIMQALNGDATTILCIYSSDGQPAERIKGFLQKHGDFRQPVILCDMSVAGTVDEQLIDFSVTSGALMLDGFGDGVWLMNDPSKLQNDRVSGRTYLEVRNNHQFLNNTAFSILQATRKRISKTEYISCPSCGRTLFDLQETTAKIRAATHHLKGVKIAIMGCIVNGPGEMADADFGYVGSGPGKITLYKSKEVVKRNVDSAIAVEALIQLLKDHGAWVDKPLEVA
jgi:(E)-4-hydroxy-3-methylbut-2-enyl-diphosphate synthase